VSSCCASVNKKALPSIPPGSATTKNPKRNSNNHYDLEISAAKILLFPVTTLLIGKIKRNPIVFIEFQCSIKQFSALAFETFDKGGLAFGQQVRHLPIG
jgi:hypothetical protein